MLLALALAALALQPVRAAQDAAIDARELGVAESLMSWCARVDPEGSAKIQARVNQMVAGRAPELLEETRQSEPYRSGYASVSAFTPQIDPHNTRKYCSESRLARPVGAR